MRELERIKESVSSGRPANICLWYGEERFFLKEALKILKSLYYADDPSGSGIEQVSAKELSPAGIVERANTMSFFARRLLIVEDVPYFQAAKKNANMDKQTADLGPFFDYFANPNPSACLLFIAESVNRGGKLYKALAQTGEVLEFVSPKRTQEWLAWLQVEVRMRDKVMPAQTAVLFLDWAGRHTGVLCRELDKLCLYVGERRQITAEDIQALTPRSIETGIFDLLDAAAGRSAPKALRTLTEVMQKEPAIYVLTMLVRQIRLLLGCDSLRRSGGSSAEVPGILKISPYEAQKVWQQAAKFSTIQLNKALAECLRTDKALKTGGGDPKLLLETMLIKFCAGK